MIPASPALGIDFGGSKIRTARVLGDEIQALNTQELNRSLTSDQVMRLLTDSIEATLTPEVHSIGIGVPGTVELERGIVYDLENVPSWTCVPLKETLEARYGLPVTINNDANCFAWGEAQFGKGKPYAHVVGMTVGTGLGSGIVINRQLYSGRNCGAGEFGVLPYLDHTVEHYASGHFFLLHQTTGEAAFSQAKAGDKQAIQLFEAFGKHLGQAVKMVLLTLDPDVVILGGSVSQAFPYFEKNLRKEVDSISFSNVRANFNLLVSEEKHTALLGAAALGLPIYTNQ